jgi:hypothetical protein
LVLVYESEADEEPEHRAAERFGESRRVVRGPRNEGSVGPKAPVGDEAVQVRMPVRTGAVRRQAGHDADGKIVLIRQRANGNSDGAGSDASNLAEQATPVEAIGAAPLGETRVRTITVPLRDGPFRRNIRVAQA